MSRKRRRKPSAAGQATEVKRSPEHQEAAPAEGGDAAESGGAASSQRASTPNARRAPPTAVATSAAAPTAKEDQPDERVDTERVDGIPAGFDGPSSFEELAPPESDALVFEAEPPSGFDDDVFVEPAEAPPAPVLARVVVPAVDGSILAVQRRADDADESLPAAPSTDDLGPVNPLETEDTHKPAEGTGIAQTADPAPGAKATPDAKSAPGKSLAASDKRTPPPSGAANSKPTPPRLTIALASGKGGVGKSVLASSIAIYLAQLGRKVTLIDASLGAPNLHTLIGTDECQPSLADFFAGKIGGLDQAAAETPFAGLRLIAATADGPRSANPSREAHQRMLTELSNLRTEFVVIDVATGSSHLSLDAFLTAQVQLIVVQPEPTAIESAVRLLKSAFLERLSDLDDIERLVAAVDDPPFGIPTPQQLLRLAQRTESPNVGRIQEEMERFRPLLLLNQTRTRQDLELGQALTVVLRRHLGLGIEYLGYVEHDDLVWASVRNRRAMLVQYPEAKVGKDIERIARRILALENPDRTLSGSRAVPLAEQNYYELLGIHPGATEAEVRSAERRVRRIYDASSPAIYGVVPAKEVVEVLGQVELAYATLVDPEKSQLYIRSIFPDWQSVDSAPAAKRKTASSNPSPLLGDPDTTPAPLRTMPVITESTAFSGQLLKAVRQARGLELDDLADHTKISISHLRAIEQENFANTPAPVYMRGFVRAVARFLGLEPTAVVTSYMERCQQRMEARE